MLVSMDIKFNQRGHTLRKKRAREIPTWQLFPNRVGRWKIISHKGEYWPCRCDCGTKRKVAAKNLRSGRSQSCGCLRLETLKEKLTTHGLSRTKEYRRHYNVTHWGKYLLLKAKANARRNDVPCNLDEGDILIPKFCPILNIPISPHATGRAWNTPTVERLVPSKGYVKGNIIIISWRANRLKCDASFDEIERLYNFYCVHMRHLTELV